MNDCCSFIADGSAEDIDTTFSRSIIANDLKRYHKYGPRKSSRILSSLIEQHRSQQDVSLCDVGSGIGSIAHAFLNGNSTAVTVVETSSAYIKASEEEAQKRGTHDRITYHHGDYVHLAYEIGSHDLMCLDRVLCCYPNMDSLVGLSAINTKSLLAIVIPRDTAFHRILIGTFHIIHSLWNLLRPSAPPPPFYMHRLSDINETIKWCGLVPLVSKTTFFWRIALYQRSQP
jgi:hypothetical protein